MVSDVSHGPVHERLAVAIAMELAVAEALTGVARALGQTDGIADVGRLQTVVREHVAALAALGLDPGDHATDTSVATDAGRPTEAVTSAERGFAAATQAYAVLHATARVLYEPDVCDLAERHLAHHIDGLQIMARLLPGAVAADLNADGLFCQCICPSCSLGACLCVRSSIGSVADSWGWPGLAEGDGVELRSPPRPGSQLAAAGVHQHDRVLSVGGAPVRTNEQLQAALRRHSAGETAQLALQRSTGELVEVSVRR
jgi:hypothetical protein